MNKYRNGDCRTILHITEFLMALLLGTFNVHKDIFRYKYFKIKNWNILR